MLAYKSVTLQPARIKIEEIRMEKWILVIGIVGICFLILVLLESKRERRKLNVTQYNITSKKLRKEEVPKKIVFLSDLHSKEYGVRNQQLVQRIIEEQPDIICIGGDMMVGCKADPCTVSLQLIEDLKHLCPIYYANGNHEQRMKWNAASYGDKYERYKAKLLALGVKLLENDLETVELGDQFIQIAGIEIPQKYFRKMQYHKLTQDEFQERLGESLHTKLQPELFQVLLAHHPMHIDAYRTYHPDLVLSGHLHGGIIRLPWIGGVITPQLQLFPRWSGEYNKIEDTHFIISKGLGEHTLKFRFGNIPEVIVIQCQGQK